MKTVSLLAVAMLCVAMPLAVHAESDLAAYMRGKMFRMWVNDDSASPTRRRIPLTFPSDPTPIAMTII